ncbi:MAG: DUF3047 domain-containing protein [Candidatus Omnitrophica bacterium]|nr:DUF3047 domain-containing protein [Candidatus Omnitrophota bacterium]
MKKAHFWQKGLIILSLFSALAAAIFFIFIAKHHRIEPAFLKRKLGRGVKQIIKHFSFSKDNSLKEWEEKILKGKVIYLIEKENRLSYVRAKSEKAASALYYKVKIDIARHPIIKWKWRVDEFPTRTQPERIEDTKEEDFAARVYVIFPAAFFTKSRVIEYIWAETLTKGTCGASGYSKNIKIMVLEKGAPTDWRHEERNIYEDYVKLFDEEPALEIGAIAFMTDADSTHSSADAVYDEIEIGYK